MLEERTGANGSLLFYRQQVKEALAAWATYNSRQAIKAPTALGVWAETIDKNRAYVRTIEAECREINRLLDIERAKEAATTKAHSKPRGIMKMKGGVLSAVDGRAVVAGQDGEFTFSDNGDSVTTYLDDLKQEKLRKPWRSRKPTGNAASALTKREALIQNEGPSPRRPKKIH